ncbi:MAG: molybdopterin-dependent oxidoreductase [Deltaproteobacteria bacterium]|nr:molybdopterin-dependent oxidoreductase [Deltaproteobacteria bacterium]
MALVKLEIDGKRMIADSGRTILEVARDNGIHSIPTLCHDDQLEPFASCFLCVVKVHGARTLLPACSTKVAAGMVVDTNHTEVRKARKAALELLLSNHYADCLGPCQLHCPAGIDIQGYVALAALGKYNDAIQLIKERNPLPAICGRVCTRPCEVKGCRRNMLDEAVGIDYIKRYLADVDLGRREPFRPKVEPRNSKRVAVVGGGPAGLSAAYYLAVRGYGVEIFETLPEAGGMLRYGIPEYRLPKDVLDLEISQILDLGVKLTTNVSLGKDFTLNSLREQGFDAVFLGLGAWDSTKMRVQDENAEGVMIGIDFLKQVGLRKKIDIHGTVLVVGGGNTAMDCARTSLRLGAKEVRVVYRRTRKEMPANAVEIHEAEEEGIIMEFLVAPTRVVTKNGRATGLECLRMELGEPDASGRRSPKPVKGSEFVIEADFIIAAIGQGTKVQELLGGRVPNFLPPGEVLNLTRWQTVKVNPQTFETSVEGVFAGGDVQTGAATVVEAVAAGRKAAHAIDKFIQTGHAEPEPVEFFSKKDTYGKVQVTELKSQEKSTKRRMPILTPDERKRSFAEAEQGYTTEDLRKETQRCQECGCMALFTCDLRRYATDYEVDITSYLGDANKYEVDRTHPVIELDPNKCILCARCVRTCSEIVGAAAYGFINRGFSTAVKPALGGSLLETECVSCGICIGTCPTGAIAQRSPLSKPGPWRTDRIPTVCHYCGVGCKLNYSVYGDTLIEVSRYEEPSASHGHHCKYGRFGYHYIQSADRLTHARIRAGRELEEATVDEAIQNAATRLRELTRKYSGKEIAVFLSPRMTNEEIYLAQKLARIGLGTHNVTSFANLINKDLYCPDVMSTATYADVEDAQAILIVNSNLDEEHFTVDLLTKRALRKGGKVIHIGTKVSRLAHFADVFLHCKPGTEVTVLHAILKNLADSGAVSLDEHAELGRHLATLTAERVKELTGVEDALVAEAAAVLGKSILKVVIFNKDYRGTRAAADDRLLAEAADALGSPYLALREKSNMQGLHDLGASPNWLPGYAALDDAGAVETLQKEWCVVLKDVDSSPADIAQLLVDKKIKVALVFGEDPVGSGALPKPMVEGLLSADFLLVADLVFTPTAKAANVVLPLSALAETSGTTTSHERRVQRLSKAVPSPFGMETWQIICELGARMGYRFKLKYANVGEVFEEIRRAVPLYRDVVVDSADPDGIWDRGVLKLPTRRAAPAQAGTIQPQKTLHLDALELRFDTWFDDAMAAARKAIIPPAAAE